MYIYIYIHIRQNLNTLAPIAATEAAARPVPAASIFNNLPP